MRSPKRSTGARRRLSLLLVILAVSFFGYSWSGIYSAAVTVESNDVEIVSATQDGNYSRFSHSNASHGRMPCLLCHRRDSNSARISYPGKIGHTPCIGCHTVQFQDSSNAICSICHTDARSGAVKQFPRLQTFGRKFDHNRHQRVNCSVCHKTAQRGIALSIPSGTNAHTTCFQCHTASAAMTMSSCNVCHQPGRLIRTPETAAAYRINFSHAKHTNAGLNCASCHSVRSGGTGRQVTKPAAKMHFPPVNSASCAACHNGKRSFGANDFENCKRCHLANSFRF